MTGVKTVHEHGVESFKAYFRGVLVDEFETEKEALDAVERLQASFNKEKHNVSK